MELEICISLVLRHFPFIPHEGAYFRVEHNKWVFILSTLYTWDLVLNVGVVTLNCEAISH